VILRLSTEQRTAGLRKPVRSDGIEKATQRSMRDEIAHLRYPPRCPKKPLEPSRNTA
jgi:hypothetical protein